MSRKYEKGTKLEHKTETGEMKELEITNVIENHYQIRWLCPSVPDELQDGWYSADIIEEFYEPKKSEARN